MLLADCHLFQSSGDLFPVVFEIQHDDILTEIDVIEICECLEPVSYTHLDVYKRQEYDYLLNSDKQLDLLDKRFIVFELDNISSNLSLIHIYTLCQCIDEA